MKLLNKLTLKSLRLNKVRTIVTIVGIMLSAALITVSQPDTVWKEYFPTLYAFAFNRMKWFRGLEKTTLTEE